MSDLRRWWPAVVGMVAGYWFLGPVGGFVGLGAGWFWQRQRDNRKPARLPPDLAAAYETLGVSPEADQATVTEAYRRLMNRHHPDKLPTEADPAQRRQADERTAAIRRAYERICASRDSGGG